MASPDGAVTVKHVYTCLWCPWDPSLWAKTVREKEKKNDLVSGDMLIFEVSLRSFEQMQKYQTNSQGLVQAPGLGKVSGALENYSSVDPQISVCRDHRWTRPF